jgi:hypothetical protein
MTNNVMENILSIEMGQMVMDGEGSSNCIMILTKRNKYCFRLSEKFPVENQVAIFRQFIADVQTPDEQPKVQETTEETAPVEKHDGAKLFDETIPAPTNVEIATQD